MARPEPHAKTRSEVEPWAGPLQNRAQNTSCGAPTSSFRRSQKRTAFELWRDFACHTQQNSNGSSIYLFGMLAGRLRWLRRPITVATIVDPKPAQNSSVGIVFVADSRLGMLGYAETVHREAMEGQVLISIMFMILRVFTSRGAPHLSFQAVQRVIRSPATKSARHVNTRVNISVSHTVTQNTIYGLIRIRPAHGP